MWYIVWNYPYTSYQRPQGDGYYVGWKNKCEDSFSQNWIEAKKYTSLGAAISRLGLKTSVSTIEDFISLNIDNDKMKQVERDKLLSDILEEEYIGTTEIFFNKGRIDKISKNGEFIGSASDDIVNLIKGNVEKQKKKNETQRKKLKDLGIDDGKYISNEDFWDLAK